MTKKAEVLELIKITPCKRHAWYRCFLPKQKTEVIIKKEYKNYDLGIPARKAV